MSNNKNYVYGKDVSVPAHLNLGKYILEKLRNRTNKDDIALENMDSKQKLFNKELIQYAVNMSASLTKLGIGRGDTVGVGCEPRNDAFPITLAIIFSGATCTLFELKVGKSGANHYGMRVTDDRVVWLSKLAPTYKITNFKHQLNISQPKYFICSKQFWSLNQDVMQDVACIKMILSMDDPFDSVRSTKDLASEHVDVDSFEPATVFGQTDVAFIMYSSGTTGLSKGIQQTYLNGILNSLPFRFQDESIESAFLYGSWNAIYVYLSFSFLVTGIKIVYPENVNNGYVSILRSIDQYKVNLAIVLPAMMRLLTKHNKLHELYNLNSLKMIYVGTCTIHRDTIESVQQRFPNLKYVLQGYGMTETLILCSEHVANNGPKPGSVGNVFPGITLKVSDLKTRKAVGPNERGEICVKSPGLGQAYVGMDPSYGKDDEGFFRTGDLGYYDDDGYFYIVDRLKEIISFDGCNVIPLELENILLKHPEVKDAAVVGKPDPVFEELPTAFVVRVPGSIVTEKELSDYVSGEVAPDMQLRGGIYFINEIPVNSRGKIMKQSLRNMLKGN